MSLSNQGNLSDALIGFEDQKEEEKTD